MCSLLTTDSYVLVIPKVVSRRRYISIFLVNRTDVAAILNYIKRFKHFSKATKFAQFSPNLAQMIFYKVSQNLSDGFLIFTSQPGSQSNLVVKLPNRI